MKRKLKVRYNPLTGFWTVRTHDGFAISAWHHHDNAVAFADHYSKHEDWSAAHQWAMWGRYQ